jgi:hypothetical protein
VLQLGDLALEPSNKSWRVVVKFHPQAHNLGSLFHAEVIRDMNFVSEAIEELRAELAFFGVHGANQHILSGDLLRDAIAFDTMHSARGRIQQRVGEVIGKQIHFVNVEDALMSLGQQSSLRAPLVFLNKLGSVNGT